MSIEIPGLIEAGQSEHLHWFPENVAPTELAETLVALANSDGGTLLLGVAPRGTQVQGIKDSAAAVDKVFQAALLADPVLVLPIPREETYEGKTLLLITVPPGLPHVYNLNGRYLIREARQNVTLPARSLRQMLVSRGAVPFDTQVPPGVDLDDLDESQVSAYIETLGYAADADWREVLVARGCLLWEGKALKPTYAALLLFGRNPQRWLPNAAILAAHFPGISFYDEFIKQDITGSLPNQLRQAEAFLRENLKKTVRVVGLAHEETLEYPFAAVRELLVNAVAHRDYNLQGDTIHLHVFSDRLEVHSPGGLPGPVTMQNLLLARFSRNAVIVQVLSDLGFVERLGYGLNRVVTAMRQHGLEPPRFKEVGGTFRVTLMRKIAPQESLPDVSVYRGLELNPRQQLVIGYLASNPRITNSIYQELCPDVSPETLRRDFADLVSQGVLIKMGSKRATYYILKGKK